MADDSPLLSDPSLLHEASLLNDEWVEAQSGKRVDIEVQDPDMSSRLAPRTAQRVWYELITNAREDIAKIVVYETGKPMAEAIGEVDYALEFAWWFTGQAERLRGSIALPSISNRCTFVINQPIRVAAALAAGRSMVVKLTPETPLSVMSLADLALRAGLTPGVLNTTDNEYTPAISERLYKHPLVGKATFTGSTRVGSIITKHYSDRLKKVTLYSRPDDPQVAYHRSSLYTCQPNRVYVQAGVYDMFAKMMLEATQKLKKLNRHVSDAVSKGGKLLLFSGKQPYGPQGYFFEPTIISDMISDMLASQEEIFGPPFSLYRFEIEDEAVKQTNGTSMGLASYFFTKNAD
ncbi:hypothetical protein ETB97_000395 [Aspergillus alliaceus]|uniref:Aldehyde dehydrogenase domain-containing protein n=1 Tax=Petromyces alliaceus TaxID=209559 RepID=A0A8H6A5A0_PETAA|nr:hypothetical protein ETB97_000395 [Aspergillus burnettii]